MSQFSTQLNWETAHEPDSDPEDATRAAIELPRLELLAWINIVLMFIPSDTERNPDFGQVLVATTARRGVWDVTVHVQTYNDRLNILGFDCTKFVWTSPQARPAMGYEFISFTNGAIVLLIPTTTGNIETIEGTAINLDVIAKDVQPFITHPDATFASYDHRSLVLTTALAYMFIIANLGNTQLHVPWNGTRVTGHHQRDDGVTTHHLNTNLTGLRFQSGCIGTFTDALKRS
ncbi:hypothetical protein BDR04DRAFT_1138119 [Suillus decipiens]|nr:hypothetical protein BDR04DRAFT_1138119 [Suillus decipiens]